jgi:16S rRNA (cytosine967-C5)-methyltransferase
LLDVQPGQRVLDLCAAPGGKTAHILENQPALATLVAVDIDGQRVQRIADNVQRLSLVASLITADATKPELWWDGQTFDRILLDAPCSALGVIRRHPDIKLLRRATDIAVLQDLQRQILQAAWTMLSPGGILLYATCSVLKQENASQIKAFLSSQTDAVEIIIDAEWGIAQVCGRQILTGESAMDGFYYAKLRKQ